MLYAVIGRETITGLGSAKGFTTTNIPPTEPNTTYAKVQAVTKDVRYCIDGTTPESTKGMRLRGAATLNDIVEIWGSKALQNFLAIEESASATLEVIYFGRGS